MIRRFWRDLRGNFGMITAFAMLPIMGGVALAVDYAEMSRQRQLVENALDAAAIATARHVVDGASDPELIAYATDFFHANLGGVDPADTTLAVTLPTAANGGGTLKLDAVLDYKPYFLPAFKYLLNHETSNDDIHMTAGTEVRLKNTLEVALVLDNSGSMSDIGEGSGEERIDLLKDAAKQLVETLAAQALLIKQVDKPVQFAVVPFAASVNVGPTNDSQPWMDTMGVSPIHHENFDWTKMTAANDPDKYAEFANGVWYKRGSGWGDTENQPLTRFSLYSDITVESDREQIEGSRHWVCYSRRKDGTCRNGDYEYDYTYTYGPFTSWQGCVEARPYPYNDTDTAPTSDDPATLFVPTFAPDEPGNLWRDLNHDGVDDLDGTNFGYSNNWWADWDDSNAASRQSDMRKYFRIKPYDSSRPRYGDGPNSSCTTGPITPLADVSVPEGLTTVENAIDAMEPNGNTDVPEGLAWGWRAVSSGPPFTEGRPESEKGNDKIVIVLTDGANTYGDLGSTDAVPNRSTYAAYGYTGKNYNGTSVTRLFTGTSGAIGTYDYTASNYTAALNEQFQTLCANAKKAHIMVMTVALDLDEDDAADQAQIAGLRSCASDSRFRMDSDDPTKPAKLFWNATGATLSDDFREIANELSNLRIVN